MDIFLSKLEIATMVVLLVFAVLNITQFSKPSSTGIAAWGVLFVLLISIFISDRLINELADYSVGFTRLVWYFGFAAVDLLAIMAIYKLHIKLSVEFDKVAVFCVRMLQLLAIIQVVRFFDRHVLDVLGSIYQVAIPSINAIMVIVVASATAVSLSKKN
ncbi:hypothetical protein [Shewanella sp. MBTL60-007]|uniref:hypothetical protein n=1 Tax=Shewanella sp. MBTL60-007 TaxID=2815911 RepID=UPI001C7E877B|nr:hypothetical protein [Shewanella sp. MBTL60-007]